MRQLPIVIIATAFFVLMVGSLVDGQYGISSSSEQEIFRISETVNISIEVTEASLITIQVQNQSGSVIYIKTISADQPTFQDSENVYIGECVFKLSESDEAGTYRYYVSAVNMDGTKHGMISDYFIVSPPPYPVDDDSYIDIIPVPLIAGAMVVSLLGVFWAGERSRFFMLTWIFLPLYTRLKKDIETDIYQQNNRGRIYQHIKENPGTTLSSIRMSVETGNGTTVYHLNVLEKSGSVVKYTTRYYVKGSTPLTFGTMRRQLNLKEQDIVNYLLSVQRSTELMISQKLNTNQSSINRTLKRLMNFGVVVRNKNNGVFSYTASMKYRHWTHQLRLASSPAQDLRCPACQKDIPVSTATFCPYCSTNLKTRQEDY